MLGNALPEKDRKLAVAIGEVLHYVWDPIGVAGCPQARDEYDSYVPLVFAKTLAGDRKAIIEYLRWVETERMGLTESSAVHYDKVVDALLDWKKSFES